MLEELVKVITGSPLPEFSDTSYPPTVGSAMISIEYIVLLMLEVNVTSSVSLPEQMVCKTSVLLIIGVCKILNSNVSKLEELQLPSTVTLMT